jgi:transcriptional regulator with XRE-family HTH domain
MPATAASPVLSDPAEAALTIAATAVPTISPGRYVQLRRKALHLSLEDVALLLGSTPAVPTIRRVEWLASIEADVTPLSLPTIIALHDTIKIDLRVLAYWMQVAAGARPSLVDVLLGAGIEIPAGLDDAA